MDSTNENQARWIKFGGQDQLKNIFFVGKDAVAFYQSFFILILKLGEVKSSRQYLTYEVCKEDDEVDGIICAAGNETLPMFATATSKAQIQLFSYPTFAKVITLRNKSESRCQALAFSDGEIILSLSCSPDYALTIWNWLSGKKLRTVLTNTTSLNQKLICSSSLPILISQISEDTNELTIWEASPSYNTCHVVSKSIEMPKAKYYSCCWSPDGILWIINDNGDIYYIDAASFNPILFLQQGKKFDLNYMKPCIGCFKSILITGTGNGTLKTYKKCNGKWSSETETFGMKTSLLKLKNSYDWNALVGWNSMGEILEIELSDSNVDDHSLTASIIINFGLMIHDICVINPEQKHFASINDQGLFQVWDIHSGELVSSLQSEGKCMVEHPYLPVIAVGSDEGAVHFLNLSDAVSPRILCSYFLDHFVIEKLLFDHSGIYAVAASLNAGKFFVLQTSPSSEAFYQVTHHLNLEKEVLSVSIISSPLEFFLAILFPAHQVQGSYEKNVNSSKEEIMKVEICTINATINHDIFATLKQELALYRGIRINNRNLAGLGKKNEILHHATLKLQPFYTKDELRESIVNERHYYSNLDVIGGPVLKNTAFYAFLKFSQRISILEINSKDLESEEAVKVTKVINTGHQIRCSGKMKKGVQIGSNCKSESLLVTFGADGLVFVYHHNIRRGHEQRVTKLRNHHYLCGGVRRVILIPSRSFLLSLGWDGCIIAKRILIANHTISSVANETETNSEHANMIHLLKNLPQEQISTPGFSKSWIQLKTEEELRKKREESVKEKKSIFMEFEALKSELIAGIERNLSTSEKLKLPLLEFDLNGKLREEKIKKAEIKRKEEELKILNIIEFNKNRAEELSRECWNTMEVKGKCIKAVKEELEVENYPMMPENADYEENIGEVIERRVMEIEITINKLFTPWIPKSQSYTQRLLQQGLQTAAQSRFSVKMDETTRLYMTMMLETDDVTNSVGKGPIIDNEADFRWSGSISHKFVNVPECLHRQQLELLTLNSSHDEAIILEYVINLLRRYFNSEFKKTEDIKKHIMSKAAETVSKLHKIKSEYIWCSNAVFGQPSGENINLYKSSNAEQLTIYSSVIFEPKWSPQEIPERGIMNVDDSEVNAIPNVTPEEEQMVEEEVRRARGGEEFRERALIEMMDGVLEKCWVDEIKQDVPKPSFLNTKSPDEWNQTEIKLAKEYEMKIKFLNGERERYRKILAHEFEICNDDLMGELLNFDKKLLELYKLKLQVDASVYQESMKMMSMQLRNDRILLLNGKEHELLKEISELKEKIDTIEIELKDMRSACQECANIHESLAQKDRQLERSFGKENDFSAALSEQRGKSFRRRPKVHFNSSLSMALILEMWKLCGPQNRATGKEGRHSLSLEQKKSMSLTAIKDLLATDGVEYLHTLDSMDTYAFPGIDEENWTNLCKLRRAKIQSELRLKISAEELGDTIKVIEQCQLYLKSLHSNREKLLEELNVVHKTKLDVCHDAQVQLILKNGMMEIDRDVSIYDFSDTILIHQLGIDSINETIKEKGEIKLRAMQDYADFRRTALLCEWEHKKMKMEMEDLDLQIKTLECTKVTKDMLMLLCSPDKEEGDKLEREMNHMKEIFGKKKKEFLLQMDGLDQRILSNENENKKLDKAIQMLSIDINEQLLHYDPELEDKATMASNARMAAIVKRSQTVKEIQNKYNEILVLQTELELLRLKTFPTFRYTSVP